MILPILTPAVLLYGKVAAFVATAYAAIKKHSALSAIKAELVKVEAEAVADVKSVVARIKAKL